MDCIGRKKVPVAGAQGVSFAIHVKLKFAADDPVRLMFSMRVIRVSRAGCIRPSKNAVAFNYEMVAELFRVGRISFRPAVNCDAHDVSGKVADSYFFAD